VIALLALALGTPLTPSVKPWSIGAGPGYRLAAAPAVVQAGRHSLPTLLDELATRTTIRLDESGTSFEQLTKPTPTQARALALIESHTPTT
jgi:hypothetical protein